QEVRVIEYRKASNCCNGLPSESKCDIIANDVDPCDYSSSCIYDKTSGSAKCFNEDRKGGIWIGIVICLLGGVAANIGLNVQKYAFTKYQDELNKKSGVDDDVNSINNLERSSLYRKLERFMFWKQIIVSPLWVLGLGIYIFGSLLGFVALKFAPQSLVAPLGVVSLVVNLIIAPILHHQKLTIWDIVGVVIIICGSIVITVFSGIVIQDYKLCALIGLFHRIQTIVYLSTIAAFICALFTFIRVIERNAAREDEIALAQEAANIIAIGHENSTPESTNVNESSLIEGENGSSAVVTEQVNDSMDKVTHTLFNKKDITDKVVLDVSNAKHIPPTRNSISSMRTTGSAVRKRNLKEKVLLPLAYAILASSLATITTLFAKSLVNLLTISFVQKDNQFKDLLSWMILLITVSTAIGQVYWINMGLKKYDALLQINMWDLLLEYALYSLVYHY
ncbi:7566_t:CDS:2, partial [Funneliformis mosseae]